MDKYEYETLQKLITEHWERKKNAQVGSWEHLNSKEKEGYKEAILAVKSLLSNHQAKQEKIK